MVLWAEVAAAETAIGAGSGIIRMHGAIAWDATVTFNGGGSYIVEGDGSSTLLTSADGISIFGVSGASSITFRNFDVNTTAWTAGYTVFAISASSRTLIDNIYVWGGGTYGTGVSGDSGGSDYITVQNCYFGSLSSGVRFNQTEYTMVLSNLLSCTTTPYWGYLAICNIVCDNVCSYQARNTNKWGIHFRNQDYGLVNGNIIIGGTLNRQYGIHFDKSTKSVCYGNVIYYVTGTYAQSCYGIIINYGNNCITANRLQYCQNTTGGAGGIYIQGGSDSAVIGNSMSQCKTTTISDSGIGTYINDNQEY